MEQSADSTGFPLWRALAYSGLAAAAFTAIAIFSSPSSALADDGSAPPADPGLLGAVTQVVSSLEQPVDAVASVVDAVDTTVLEPVVSVVDDTVAAVPVVNDVVEQTLGEAPVASIVEPVVDVVDQTLTGVGDAVGGVAVPAPPTVPVLPVDTGQTPPVQLTAATEAAGPPSTSPAGTTPRVERAGDGAYAAFLAGGSPLAATGADAGAARPGGAHAPQEPQAQPDWAVPPSGSSMTGTAAGSGGAAASDTGVSGFLPVLAGDRRGPARDDDLPPAPTFPTDTAPD